MERLLSFSNAPFCTEAEPSGLIRKTAVIVGLVSLLALTSKTLASYDTSVKMYSSVGLSNPQLTGSISSNRLRAIGRPFGDGNYVAAVQPSNGAILTSSMSLHDAYHGQQQAAWYHGWVFPILAASMALGAFLSRVRTRKPESIPLASSSSYCITMASVASTKPSTQAASVAGPRKRVLVFGPTGYIGKFATLELIKRGYDVVAVTRERSGIGGKKSKEDVISEFPGAQIAFGDVCDPASVAKIFKEHAGEGFDTVVSCLASRNGGIEDSWKIDYQATSNVLQAARANKVRHFVLLSAICVQKPLLEFQFAKLKFEQELINAGDISYSIVRPTAFFKSLAGQVKSVKGGGPYVMFGDGQLSACKPISERDLASFMADCVEDETKVNKVLPIGGPGEALTPLQQGEILYKILGKKPFYVRAPIALMDVIIGVLDWLAGFKPDMVDAVEFGRIGRYYATESMLVYDPVAQKYLPGSETPSYGQDTLEDFFRNAVKDGGLAGQELGDAAVFGD